MICPGCKERGETSTVHQNGGTLSTCMAGSPGHYDEAGTFVPGVDPNTHTTLYRCSRGHALTVVRLQGRPDEIRVETSLTHWRSAWNAGSDETLRPCRSGTPATPTPENH